jgi:hypothetical protein
MGSVVHMLSRMKAKRDDANEYSIVCSNDVLPSVILAISSRSDVNIVCSDPVAAGITASTIAVVDALIGSGRRISVNGNWIMTNAIIDAYRKSRKLKKPHIDVLREIGAGASIKDLMERLNRKREHHLIRTLNRLEELGLIKCDGRICRRTLRGDLSLYFKLEMKRFK